MRQLEKGQLLEPEYHEIKDPGGGFDLMIGKLCEGGSVQTSKCHFVPWRRCTFVLRRRVSVYWPQFHFRFAMTRRQSIRLKLPTLGKFTSCSCPAPFGPLLTRYISCYLD